MIVATRVFLFLALAVISTADAATPPKNKLVEIKLIMSEDGAHAYFDPVGVHIQPGDTVRWVQMRDYHSVAAYHPANSNHELRIPDGADPWNSDILLGQYPAKGSTYEHRFTIEGVYDFFCQPHEAAGMVGRIIVGKPGTGPGTRPFGYAPEKKWNSVPAPAQKQFPAIETIMRAGVVPAAH